MIFCYTSYHSSLNSLPGPGPEYLRHPRYSKSTLTTIETLKTIEDLLFAPVEYPLIPHSTPDATFTENNSNSPQFETPQLMLLTETPPSRPLMPTYPPVPIDNPLSLLERPHSPIKLFHLLSHLPSTAPISTHPPISPIPIPVMTTTHMPLVNNREAPRFFNDVTGFDSFFNQVEELASPTRACEDLLLISSTTHSFSFHFPLYHHPLT